jgi:hypothetical protein
VGFLDKLFGRKKEASQRPPAATPRRYPSNSMIDEVDLRSVTDFNRHYPLPPGFEYRQRGPSPTDIVVVRQSDGQEFVLLVEEGILSFDVPRQKEDGTWGKRTTEVIRRP